MFPAPLYCPERRLGGAPLYRMGFLCALFGRGAAFWGGEMIKSNRLNLLAGSSLSALVAGLVVVAPHSAMADCGSPYGGTTASACTWSTGGSDLSITGTGKIVVPGGGGAVQYGPANVGTLSNAGTISGTSGIASTNSYNGGTSIAAISNSGTILATGGGNTDQAILNNGTIGGITNTLLIKSQSGSGIDNEGSITSIANTGGTIQGAVNGITNGNGHFIGNIDNTGTILSAGSSAGALMNSGAISAITNSGTIQNTATTGAGLYNYGGSIGLFTNSPGGYVNGGQTGVVNFGTITSLSNSGTITGSTYGLNNANGTIGSLTIGNGGTISGTGANGVGINNTAIITYATIASGGTIIGTKTGLANSGTISTLTNSGSISGTNTGLLNTGSIGTLTNSGTISGSAYALNITGGSLGPVTNSGVINGSIQNTTGNNLTINGGSGSTFGTLTGGSITNLASNVVFGSGNILLADNVNVTGHTLSNTGAVVKLTSAAIPTITGTYSQTGGGLLIVATNSTSYGYMTVTGPATVNNSTITISGSGLTGGTLMNIVRSGTSGTYTGDTATVTGSSLTATLVTAGNNLEVCLGTWSGGSCKGGSGNVDGVGGSYTGSNSKLKALSDAVQALNTTQQTQAAAQLKAVPHAATTQAAMQPAMEVLAVVAAHVDNTRLARNDDGQTGVAAGNSGHGLAMWGEAFGGAATQDRRADTDGFSVLSGGMLVGVDTAVSERWRTGAVASYAQARVEDSGDRSGSSTRLQSYGLIGYASYTGNPWYVDLSAGGILHKYQTTRLSTVPGASGVANGGHDGQQFISKIEGGYPLAVGPQEWNATLTPLAGVTYSHLHQNSYSETDSGNGMALQVDGSTSHSVKSDFGAKIERGFHTDFGDVVPDLRAIWRHEYLNTTQQGSADYTADDNGSAAFTSSDAAPPRDSAILGVGTTVLAGDDLTLSAKFETELADRYIGYTGRLRVRQAF